MNRILSLDPSGTGTTGVCLIEGQKVTFQTFQSKDWAKHCEYIYDLLRDYQPELVLHETTNYINSKGKDMTSLFKLLGALEGLKYTFTFIERIDSIPVHQIKDLKAKLLAGTKKISHLTFKKGRGLGWTYQGQKISRHELDAYLV